MRLRCFFGALHGKWVMVEEPEVGRRVQLRGEGKRCDYIVTSMASAPDGDYLALVHHHKRIEDAYDWLFTYDPDHPQHGDESNHPRQIAMAG